MRKPLKLRVLVPCCVALVFVAQCWSGAQLIRDPGKATVAARSTSRAVWRPDYSALLPKLKRSTRVPVRLPTIIPDGPLFVYVDGADATSYAVGLSYSPTCDGATYCEAGYIQSIRTSGSIDLGDDLNIKRATLADGTKAYIANPRCGASCLPRYIVWISSGREYSIGLKGDLSDSDFVVMADSMKSL